MKPHPRIRKTVKWVGAVATAMLFVVWVGSGWFCWRDIQWSTSRFDIGNGLVSITRIDNWHGPLREPCTLVRGPGYKAFNTTPFTLYFGLHYEDWGDLFGVLYFPLWIPPVLALLPTVLAWHLDTIARRRA